MPSLKIIFRLQWHILDLFKIFCSSNHITPVIAITGSQIAKDGVIIQDFSFYFVGNLLEIDGLKAYAFIKLRKRISLGKS